MNEMSINLLNRKQFIKVDNKSSNVSIKIVIPTGCNAKCAFCFNHLQKSTRTTQKDIFLANLDKSLNYVLSTLEYLGRNDISLDITGNEPTLDFELLKRTLEIVSKHKHRTKRVVLTSNGFNLEHCVEFINKDMVDCVNISSHHYDYAERRSIFGTDTIPADDVITKCNIMLKAKGIEPTAVAVLYKELDGPFYQFMDKFSAWSKACSFSRIRIRSNFSENNAFIIKYFEKTQFENIVSESTKAGLYTKDIVMNDLPIRLLRGVNDLTNYVVGVECVIDDNGKPYIDYNKRFVFDDHIWVFEDVHVKI